MKFKLLSGLLAILLLSSSGCKIGGHDNSDNTDTVCPGFGIVAIEGGWLATIDGYSQSVNAPILTGQLSAAGDQLLDVAITPDGTTALVSSFTTKQISFLDTSLALVPTLTPGITPRLLGSLKISFYAEDIAITPNGRFALVTDGLYTPKIAVIDIASRTLVEEYDASVAGRNHQAVAIAPDGRTVLTVDYFGGKVHAYTLSDDGHLNSSTSIDISHGGTLKPINVSIAPDGKTAVVATASNSAATMAFPVLKITGAGLASTSGIVTPSRRLVGSQTVVFSRDGRKAYLNCVQEPDGSGIAPRNVIEQLNIGADGQAYDGGVLATLDFVAVNQLFGVDTMAIDYARNWLYVSNMSGSDAKNHVEVIDLETGAAVKTIPFDPVAVGSPASSVTAKPTGICYWN